MNHPTLRALGASVLALALAACTSEQPTGAASSARLDLGALAGPTLVINEVMPNPAGVADELGEWFEIYNAGSAPVNLQNYTIASNNDASHVINQSLVVPAGGYVVLVRNANTATNGGVTGNYTYPAAFTLANGTTDWLALRDPAGASVDSVHWGTSSPPNGASRGVIDPTLDNVLMSGTGANWSTQTSVYGLGDKGTPGAVNDGGVTPPPPPPPPGTGTVVINEILADPSAVLDANGEWFEVHNRGTAAVNLQGWTIASLNDAAHVISASVVIAPGGYAVLGRNANTATNGGVTLSYNYAGATTLNLGNGTDWLALRDGTGASVDSVAWTSVSAGTSRALIDPASDNLNVNGAAWRNSTQNFGAGDRGTPGQDNNLVVDPPTNGVASVSLSINAPRQIPVGYTKPAFPTARDGAGQTVTGVSYTWTSSDPSIAAVDSLGYIYGLSEGTATITATATGGVSGSSTITILPASVPTTAVYRNHVEFGTPDAPGTILARPEYVSSYSATRGGPNWVSWNINATHFGSAARCDCFTGDLAVPAASRVVDFNYRNSGYDRGHMVQSESRTATFQENAATFLMTNILPQAGENNQGPWVQFENHLNDLARQQGKEIYVIAGGEYSSSPATLKNEGKVQVPEWTWKVAVVMDGGEGLDDVHGTGDLQVLAIRMPNDTTSARGIRTNPWEMYATTVDAIEQHTGYDLLDALPNVVEAIVESNDRAPVAATDGPYVGIEGSSVTLSASGSSDPDGDALTYAWSFGDGDTGTGVKPGHVYADNGNYVVTVIVTDSYGAADTTTTTVTVMNVAPSVSAIAGGSLLQGETYSAGGSFADPGADSWTATVDYGDGSGAQPLALSGTGFSLSHAYASAGTFTVTVTVTDDDGGASNVTAEVTVATPGQAVSGLTAQVDGLVSSGALSNGNGNALTAKLRAAGAALARGQGATAVNQLGAFVNQVQALVQAGRLSQADGAALTAAAQRIVASIQGV
jgi:DNA/RNA endonuclease G (NUC1)